jgi:hypothetical protein
MCSYFSVLVRLSLSPPEAPQSFKICHAQGLIITWRPVTLARDDRDERKAPLLLTLLAMDLEEEGRGGTMGGEPR